MADVDAWDVLDRLDAAADLADQLHPDLCPVWRGEVCSCGIPQLLIDAARFVRFLAVESAVSQAQRAA